MDVERPEAAGRITKNGERVGRAVCSAESLIIGQCLWRFAGNKGGMAQSGCLTDHQESLSK